jgi:hypothetical protein
LTRYTLPLYTNIAKQKIKIYRGIYNMDILAKMNEKTVQFESLNKVIMEQDEVIAKANSNKDQVKEEMLRVQGEYRLLVDMGREEGIIDETGQPIVPTMEAEVVLEE